MQELPGGDSDEVTVGTKLGGGNGVLEGDAVEDGTAAEVNEEAPVVFVDCEEENAVGRGGDATKVGGGLAW